MPTDVLKRSFGTLMLLLLFAQSAVLPLGACELAAPGDDGPSHMEMQHEQTDSGHEGHMPAGDADSPEECAALATCGVAALPQLAVRAPITIQPIMVLDESIEGRPASVVSSLLTPPPKN